MTKQIISKDKQYQTRDGRKVVILADNVPGTDYPVAGYIIDGKASLHTQWTREGWHSSSYTREDHALDLSPAQVVTVEYAVVWIPEDADELGGETLASSFWYSRKPTGYDPHIGHMVRTTEEGKLPVYHFEPI
jgi:hypothetical protein